MTQAEEAAAESKKHSFGVADLKNGYGAGWNPKTKRWTFSDGSTGVFDERHPLKYTKTVRTRMGDFEDGEGAYYPFKVMAPPLEFPDAVADASIETKPVVRNAHGEAIRPILDTDPTPEYKGDHSPATELGRDGAVVKRKTHKLVKEID